MHVTALVLHLIYLNYIDAFGFEISLIGAF